MIQNQLMNILNEITRAKFADIFKAKFPRVTEMEGVPSRCVFDLKAKVYRSPADCKKDYFSLGVVYSEKLTEILRENGISSKGLYIRRTADGVQELDKVFPYVTVMISVYDLLLWLNLHKGRYSERTENEVRMALDDEYREAKNREIREAREYNINKLESLEMFAPVDRTAELIHLGALLDYKTEEIKRLISYKTDKFEGFVLPNDYKISDSRLWIPTNKKDIYVVISKNPYDAFWASSGNGFQSCFSLDSPHWGIQASPLLMTLPFFCMVYITKGEWNKFSLFKERKLQCPHIMYRCWGYIMEGKLHLGRSFGKEGITDEDFLDTVGQCVEYSTNYAEIYSQEYIDIVKKHRTYLDDIKRNSDCNKIYFRRLNGEHGFTAANYPNDTPHGIAKNITFNPYIELKEGAQVRIIDNNIRFCTISQKSKLFTDGDTHWIDRYLDHPVETTVITTFVGGYLFIDECSPSAEDKDVIGIVVKHGACGHCSSLENIKTDQKVNNTFGCVVVRTIHENKVKIDLFYGKPNTLEIR